MPRYTGPSLEVETIKFTGNLPAGRLLETMHQSVGTANGSPFFNGTGTWETVYESGPTNLSVTSSEDFDASVGDWLEAWCCFGLRWDNTGVGQVRLYDTAGQVLAGATIQAINNEYNWITLVGHLYAGGAGSAPVTVALQSNVTGGGQQGFYGEASLLVKHYRPFPTGT
jgi:hypothetical protein